MEYEIPNEVQEVFDLVQKGPILQEKYLHQSYEDLSFAASEALKIYANQDLKKPLQFLDGISEKAAGIFPNSFTDPRSKWLIRHAEKMDFYSHVFQQIFPLKKKMNLKKKEVEALANAISTNLYLCAKSRLLLEYGHPYFEKMFKIYADQGFPYAWKGRNDWKVGNFLVYSR